MSEESVSRNPERRLQLASSVQDPKNSSCVFIEDTEKAANVEAITGLFKIVLISLID